MNVKDFVKKINMLRLEDKESWYEWQGEVEGKSVRLKGYNTWLQIFKVDGVDYYSDPIDNKVAKFKKELTTPFVQEEQEMAS